MRTRTRVEWTFLVLALLLVPLILIQVSTQDPQVLLATEIANGIIWLAFALELVYLRLHSQNWASFARERWLEIAIVLLTPPFIVPAELASLRVLRVLRLVRLVAVVGRLQHRTGRTMGRQGLVYIAALVAIFVFIGGVGIHELEPERAPTIGDGLWWAVVTLTTVGYGDISPATFEGRILATGLMVSGLAVVGALAGSIGAMFLGTDEAGPDDRLDSIQRDLREVRAMLDAAQQAREGDAHRRAF